MSEKGTGAGKREAGGNGGGGNLRALSSLHGRFPGDTFARLAILRAVNIMHPALYLCVRFRLGLVCTRANFLISPPWYTSALYLYTSALDLFVRISRRLVCKRKVFYFPSFVHLSLALVHLGLGLVCTPEPWTCVYTEVCF